MYHDIDLPQERPHNFEVQMPQMFFRWRGHPIENARHHNKTDKEKGHDVKTSNNTKLTKDRNIGSQQCQETYGNGKVGEEHGESHLAHHSCNGFDFVFCLGKLEVI